MNTHSFTKIQTSRQGRELKATQRLTNDRSHRSLNFGPGSFHPLGFGFAPLRLFLNLLVLVIVVALSCLSVSSQEVDDTIRIKTRVVFLDALVKDKKSNLPVSNLAADNFEVLDNGTPRPISYFTREGQARKPLALVLILDLREDGAGRFLKNPEIIKAMENELAKLPPGDEVAIMAMDSGEDEEHVWLTEFTNDRAKLAAALAQVKVMAERGDVDEESVKSEKPAPHSTEAPPVMTTDQKPDDVVSTEIIKGKNGSVLTRTTTRDGKTHIKRVNKKGEVTVEFDDFFGMSEAVRQAARKTAATRPNSQLSLVWVSDGIAPIFFEDRDATEQVLIRDNIIFNSLTVQLRTLFKLLLPVGKPIAGWLGLSLYGSAKHLAQQSGGEAVKVGRPKDYAAGLSTIIGNLTARYSLGFALAESETDDGRMHALQVRVKAKDDKGKNRKLLVSSRQGYYMSSVDSKNSAAKAQ